MTSTRRAAALQRQREVVADEAGAADERDAAPGKVRRHDRDSSPRAHERRAM